MQWRVILTEEILFWKAGVELSQQEFEPQRHEQQNIYREQYPYGWSEQEGMPKDEPPGSYDIPGGQPEVKQGEIWNGPVPWWARPQPRQAGSSKFLMIVILVVVFMLALGGLGIVGTIFGALLHLLGVLLAAFFALLLFVALLILIALAAIRRAIRNALGQDIRRRKRW